MTAKFKNRGEPEKRHFGKISVRISPDQIYSDKCSTALPEGGGLHPEVIKFFAELIYELRSSGYVQRNSKILRPDD
jgi:hypothetical protein